MRTHRSKEDYKTEYDFYIKHREASGDVIYDQASGLIKEVRYPGPLFDYYQRNEDAYSDMTARVDALLAKGPPKDTDIQGMTELRDILGTRPMNDNERLDAAIDIAMTAPFPRMALRHVLQTLSKREMNPELLQDTNSTESV